MPESAPKPKLVIPAPRRARRNQLLAAVLVFLSASLFVIVIALALAVHYVEAHHVLASN